MRISRPQERYLGRAGRWRSRRARLCGQASSQGRPSRPLRLPGAWPIGSWNAVGGSEGIEALLKLTEFGWRNEGPAYGRFFVTLHMPDARGDQIQSACDLLRETTSPENALEILRVFFNADVSESVGRIRLDTLVLHAREDPIIPFNEGRTLASLIPNAQFVPLESRNHLLQENEPAWRTLVGALAQFLAFLRKAALERCIRLPAN